MQNDYIGTSAITMEQNYRSTGTILKAALHVITQGSLSTRMVDIQIIIDYAR
jgi:superfamily I DNA/RNA helicase